ncbi:unnamed protein product, partial [Rotaria sp. Silwood1]
HLDVKAKALQCLEKFSIPMNESIQYEVTLVKFERLEEERLLNDKEKFEQAELLKARADDLVKVFSIFFFVIYNGIDLFCVIEE